VKERSNKIIIIFARSDLGKKKKRNYNIIIIWDVGVFKKKTQDVELADRTRAYHTENAFSGGGAQAAALKAGSRLQAIMIIVKPVARKVN
jgi:hypothetical protein